MNYAGNATGSQNPLSLAEQTQGIFNVQNVEQHDEAHRGIGSPAAFGDEVSWVLVHLGISGLRRLPGE